jgi:hypothetical protein
LVYIATYLLGFVLFVWAPLYLCLALGGFRWKRLILLGQTGDMNIYVPNVVLRWVRGPQATVCLSLRHSCQQQSFWHSLW